jgi:TldD protein
MILPRWCLIALAAALPLPAQESDAVLRAMEREMARVPGLKLVSLAQPYYVEYAVHDSDSFSASATLGALIGTRRVRFRLPRIQVRVGDYQFDNTNFVGSDAYSGARYDVDELPLDDAPIALRHHLWLATDAAYKGAVEALSMKKAALRNASAAPELPDFWRFSPPPPAFDPRPRPVDDAPWPARVRKLSALFAAFPDVKASAVSVEAASGALYLLTNEGASIRVPEGSAVLRARASAQAADGMPLHDAEFFYAFDPALLPADAALEPAIRRVGQNLAALVQAPAGEPYSGPVLFEGVAAGQLLAQVLGKNLAFPRRPVAPPGRPLPFLSSELEMRIGSRVLPEWMDVLDDATQRQWRGRPLFGWYRFDLEGVPPAPVLVVDKGVLRNALLSRQPAKGFEASNGHGRLPGAFGAKAVGIGNLFVSARGGISGAALRNKLIEMCRERNKPYGLLVRKLDFPSSAGMDEIRRLLAGLAQDGARPLSPPILVYRLYPDGREELVRGLRFRGMNARTLKDIVAASDESFVFDFYDSTAPFALVGGAMFVSEASVIAPSLLIDDVELDRGREELPRPPLVPAPTLGVAQALLPAGPAPVPAPVGRR